MRSVSPDSAHSTLYCLTYELTFTFARPPKCTGVYTERTGAAPELLNAGTLCWVRPSRTRPVTACVHFGVRLLYRE